VMTSALSPFRTMRRDHKVNTARFTFLTLLIMLCWLICTIAQPEKYLSMPKAAAVCALGCVGVGCILYVLRVFYRVRKDVGVWTLIAGYLVLAASFAILYPKSLHHAPGKGSDREDALRVELAAVLQHEYPYAARTYLHHAPTPLPGAMWLSAPFFFLGHVALQNLVWAGFSVYFLIRFFRFRSTALAYLVLLLIVAAENLNDFDVGGDFVVNVMYVCLALFLVVRQTSTPSSPTQTVLAVMFLGFALSSRIIYLVTLPPVVALLVQRAGWRRALLMTGGAVVMAMAVSLPVFSPHPFQHLVAQLQQNGDKLQLIPPWLSGPVLPAVALATACCAFFLRMDLGRVFLLSGTASLVLVLPPMAMIVRNEGGLLHPLTTDLEYFAPSSMFLALWALSRWEQDSYVRPAVSPVQA
jgi:hypothetical protein